MYTINLTSSIPLPPQNSVPHLKTRLQLQQVIMKELIQRSLAEKKTSSGGGGNVSATTPPSSISPSPSTSSSVTTSSSDPSPLSQPPPTATAVMAAVPSSITIGGQAVTAVKVGTVKNSSAAKPATVPGSNVTLSNLIPNAANQSGPSLAALEQLNQQLPKVLRDKIAKLPPEQQKFVYTHHLKQLHQMKEKQLQQQGGGANFVKERQQQLVQEQQVPLVMGVAKPSGGGGASALRNSSATVSVGVGGTPEIKKAAFASMKIIPTSTSTASSSSLGPLPPSHGSKRKGKAKDGTTSQEVE